MYRLFYRNSVNRMYIILSPPLAAVNNDEKFRSKLLVDTFFFSKYIKVDGF